MATLILPVDNSSASYDFQVQLENAWYRIELYFNFRVGYWFLSCYDGSENMLVAGRKVVLGANLLGRGVDPALPPGFIFAVDTSGQNLDAGYDDLGGRVLLTYVESTGP